MNKFILLFFLLALNLPLAFGSSVEDYLRKVQKNYENLKTFRLNLNYELYKGWQGTEVMDTYSSQFFRSEEESYRTLHNSIFISSQGLSLSVDHDDKLMTISDPIEEKVIDADLEKSLQMCQDTKVVEQEDGSTKLRLILKQKSDILYSAIDIIINEKYQIKEIQLYYAHQYNFSSSYFQPEMDYPKLRITYGEIKKSWKEKDEHLNLGYYLSNTANQPTPTKEYSDYQIIDLRSVE
ncbi:MAG: hypothetical protein MI810_01905 [Flavobacteriales bacterium]|nr:hypothetical protein [Flavobacteriales bacterium]